MAGDARVLALALVLDVAIGEPPAAVHPVVWMGRVLSWLERAAPASASARLAYGALVAGLGPGLWAALGLLTERRLPWWACGALLKCAFAGRALLQAARDVEAPLERQQLGNARLALRALVSRPTTELDEHQTSAAVVESLAENLCDSWLAPLLAYALGGLPAAYAYRASNTADAMWGYHDPVFEQLGKGAARLDDVSNWLPARLSALLLISLARQPRRAFSTWRRDARRTASPNAGQPMAATAGALGVRLEKLGDYVLLPEARLPTVADVARARRLVGRAMVASGLVALVVCMARRG